MGLRIIDRYKKPENKATAEVQLSELMLQTQRWQEFHKNEDTNTQKDFIEKYCVVKKRLSALLSPAEAMSETATKANQTIRKNKQNLVVSHVNMDIATLLEILGGDRKNSNS